MKTKVVSGMLITASLLLVGCGGSKPIVEPKAEEVHSFKDYLVKKRPTPKGSYSIVAEQDNKTIVETRDYNVMLAVGEDPDNTTRLLDDVVGYCSLIGGTSIYGDGSIKDLGRFKHFSHLLNSDLKRHTTRMGAQGKGQYSGYYKCSSPRDGFEIERKRAHIGYAGQQSMTGGRAAFSSFYLIKHDKKQEVGYAKKWFQANELLVKQNTGKKLQELVSNDEGAIRYSYLLMKIANITCTYYGGELFIANRLTDNTKMSMGDYLIARTEQLIDGGSGSIFDGKEGEYLWCSNGDKSKEFSLVNNEGKMHFSQNDNDSLIASKGTKIDNSNKIQLLSIDMKDSSNELPSISKALSTESVLAKITLSHKQDTTKDTTHISYETSYNGVSSDNCSLASVINTNKSNGNIKIHNFKECKAGEMEYIGETSPSDIESKTIQNNYKAASANLIANCRVQGSAIASLEDSILAICTQGKNVNSALKIVVMKDDKLLYKTIEN